MNKTKENDTLIIKSQYLSSYEKSQIFSTIESPNINCNTDINIIFPSQNFVLFLSLNNGSKFISFHFFIKIYMKYLQQNSPFELQFNYNFFQKIILEKLKQSKSFSSKPISIQRLKLKIRNYEDGANTLVKNFGTKVE